MTAPAPFDAVKALLDGPVAFHPALARAAGGVTAGLFLSQLCYWARTMDRKAEAKELDPSGDRSVEYWKSLGEWSEETALTEKELRAARARLEGLGVVESRLDRSRHRLYWLVNYRRLSELLSGGEHLPKGQMPPAERADATCRKGSSLEEAETTAENTAETTDNNGTGAALGSPASQELPARARCSCSAGTKTAGEAGVSEPNRHSGEPSQALGCPGDDPDEGPPKPPKGGRPACSLRRTAAALARDPVHPEPVAGVMRGYGLLAQSAAAAAVPLGLVAQAVLERRDQVEVLAVLLCARAKRAKLRSPAAFFRARVLCRPLDAPAVEPRLCDWTEAKRLLVGAGVEDLGFARCLPDLDGRRPADHWREAAQARAAAAAAEKRAEDLRRLKRLLPTLRGERRRWAEAMLAGDAAPRRRGDAETEERRTACA